MFLSLVSWCLDGEGKGDGEDFRGEGHTVRLGVREVHSWKLRGVWRDVNSVVVSTAGAAAFERAKVIHYGV